MPNLLPTRFLQLHWYQQLVVVSLVVIGGSLALKALAPKPNSTTLFSVNHDQSVTRFSQATFVGTPPSVPSELALGSLSSQQTLEELQQPIVQAYQLSRINQQTPVWLGPIYSLSENKTQQNSTLSRNQMTTAGGKISTSVARKQAKQALTELYPGIQVGEVSSQTKWFLQGFDLAETQESQAEIARFVFMPLLQDIPVFSFYRYQPVFEVWMSAAGLEKLVISPPLLLAKEVDLHPSITINQALDQIKSGIGSIIYAYPEEITTSPNLNEVETAVFTTAELEYRVTPETKDVVPSYRFTGTVTTLSGDRLQADVITPAIAF